ncbi:hypothetical protein [Alkalihalobacillus trypoxylicola]|uniref:N-acetyltransferase domain-containing protein n=1 Tax=Alkalihalobacillus trypoxylicola TaxID=519424 RepID=A0A162DD26_9BACI|nr:hypothetical protein [Alkalihalobacillus trypoxylicola]KYG29236.1 hypothetical protein AZF04_06845 [Alkalihalobacillus trypoxylicola]
MSLIVRKANHNDLLKIQRLMARAGIKETAIDEQVTKFLVVENDQQEIIGTAGIEKGKNNGLIRSFILDSPTWTAEMSIEFMDIVLSYAKGKKIKKIYACTKGKNPLFYQLGFKKISSEEVPEDVSKLAHFQRSIQQEVSIWSYDLLNNAS